MHDGGVAAAVHRRGGVRGQVARRPRTRGHGLGLSHRQPARAACHRVDGQEREAKFTTLLDSIALPTLVVTSDNDHLIPKELSDLIAARIAGTKLVVMPGAGHIPFMEQPGEVVRIVLEFIAGLDG